MEEFGPDQVLCRELASELRGELTETCHMVQAAMWACALQKPMGLIWTILSCVANYGHTSTSTRSESPHLERKANHGL